MARYRKVDPRFWRDEKVIKLSTEEKAVALYVLTGQCNRIGCFSFSRALAAEDLNMELETFVECFANVLKALNWEYDENCRVLYLPRFWRYNNPENENNVVGNLKDLDELPDSALVVKFTENLEFLAPSLHTTFKK